MSGSVVLAFVFITVHGIIDSIQILRFDPKNNKHKIYMLNDTN